MEVAIIPGRLAGYVNLNISLIPSPFNSEAVQEFVRGREKVDTPQSETLDVDDDRTCSRYLFNFLGVHKAEVNYWRYSRLHGQIDSWVHLWTLSSQRSDEEMSGFFPA